MIVQRQKYESLCPTVYLETVDQHGDGTPGTEIVERIVVALEGKRRSIGLCVHETVDLTE